MQDMIVPASYGESHFRIEKTNLIRLIRQPENRAIYIGSFNIDREILFLQKRIFSTQKDSFTLSIPSEILGAVPTIKVVCIEVDMQTRTRRFCCTIDSVKLRGYMLDDERNVQASHQRYIFVPLCNWEEVFSFEEIMYYYNEFGARQKAGMIK